MTYYIYFWGDWKVVSREAYDNWKMMGFAGYSETASGK